MEISECQKDKFIIPEGISYLNCAYMSPLPKKVIEAGHVAVEKKGHPHKIRSSDFFDTTELLRSEFARIISSPPDQVALVPSVSYGIATVAKNIPLKPGDEIVVLGEQFPSNMYSWISAAEEKGARIISIDPPGEMQERGRKWNASILNAISPKTKVVAIGTVHWSDGTLFDLSSIREKTYAVNAYFILDGTQSVGAMPLDVASLKPDALIVGGYKWLMCPYSVSFAWYGEKLISGKPMEENWINRKDSENFAGLVNYKEDYSKGARRFDVGERSNFILNPMALEALKLINEWGPENIQQYCIRLTEEPIKKLAGMGYWIEDPLFRAGHLFGIRPPAGTDLEKIRKQCEEREVYVSIRGSAIRIAPNIYNDTNDIDKLIQALS